MPSQLQEAPYSPARITLIIFSLALGGLGIGPGEFAIMGLMPGVAADLGVTEPQVGHLISAYALGVVVGAPLLAIGGARLGVGLWLFGSIAGWGEVSLFGGSRWESYLAVDYRVCGATASLRGAGGGCRITAS